MTKGMTIATAMTLLAASGAGAQEVTLRLHQFLPAQANVPARVLDVWADGVEEASGGRIEIQRFPSMQLGGTAPELIDQVRDGVADIVWTVVGYTPGRFPRTEVFELPFFATDPAAASHAYWTLFEREMKDTEFAGIHVLATYVHGAGLLHTADPVEAVDDVAGMQIRGPSRLVNRLLERLGAEAVGLPAPAIPEALSKGVIDGAALPWEVTGALRVSEFVDYHTEFEGEMLYTLSFVIAMNQDAYDALPADLRAVIDEASGEKLSVFAARQVVIADAEARAATQEAGGEVIVIEDNAPWVEATRPIYDEWVAEMAGKGIDGQALIDEARRLMDAFDG